MVDAEVAGVGSEDSSRADGEAGEVAVVAVARSTLSVGKFCERGRCGGVGGAYCGANGPCVVPREKKGGCRPRSAPGEGKPTVSVDIVGCGLECGIRWRGRACNQLRPESGEATSCGEPRECLERSVFDARREA